jgi:hypothetical protein
MKDYIQDRQDLYGSVGIHLVPYLSFERKKDEKHCRIPLIVFEDLKKQGMSPEHILEHYADWYGTSTFEYRKQYRANIIARNEAERIRNQETELSDKEIVEGYLANWKEAFRKWRAKHETIEESDSD